MAFRTVIVSNEHFKHLNDIYLGAEVSVEQKLLSEIDEVDFWTDCLNYYINYLSETQYQNYNISCTIQRIHSMWYALKNFQQLDDVVRIASCKF